MQYFTKKIVQIVRKTHIEFLVANFLGKIGLRSKILKYYKLIDKARELEYSLQENTEIQKGRDENNLKFCFFSVRGSASTLAWEFLIAKSLQLRGNYVYFIFCDGILEKQCEMASSNYRAISCELCFAFGNSILKEAKIPLIKFSELINEKEKRKILTLLDIKNNFEDYLSFKYENVRIGDHAKASTLRYLGRGTLIKNHQTYEIIKKYVKSALLTTFVAKKIINDLNPDRIVTSHGIYVSWGPILEVANSSGVPIITCDRGQGYMNLIFNRAKPNFENEEYDVERIHMSKALNFQQEQVLSDFLNDRWIKNRTVLRYNQIPIQYNKSLIKRLDLNPNMPTFLLLSNVLWDAANIGRDLAFANALSWIFDTIAWFSCNAQFQLIIKIHPAENIFKDVTNQKVEDELRTYFPLIPENVKIISADTKLNTYDIIDNVDFCIVYTSTVGLEAALRNKPVIVVAKVHYREKGFTYDIDEKEDYFNLLENPNKLIFTKQMKENTRKYAYFYFIQRLIDFPFIIEKEPFKPIDFAINSYLELKENATFDIICNNLMKYSPIIRN